MLVKGKAYDRDSAGTMPVIDWIFFRDRLWQSREDCELSFDILTGAALIIGKPCAARRLRPAVEIRSDCMFPDPWTDLQGKEKKSRWDRKGKKMLIWR